MARCSLLDDSSAVCTIFRHQFSPCRRWKVSSLSTLTRARFQGPNVVERKTSPEQREARAIVERVGDDELRPTVERDVKGVRILEAAPGSVRR